MRTRNIEGLEECMDFSISQYLEVRGDLTFKNDAFADTDAVIFCQCGYVRFDRMMESATDDMEKIDFSTRYKFSALRKKILTSVEKKHEYMDVGLMNKKIPELFLDAAKTERFQNVEITGFISKMENDKNPENPEQFAAMTYILDEDTVCVVYRGTDDSIRGWKEDCNLAKSEAIPSQIEARDYLSKAIDFFEGKRIFVAGHSKGGNIAMYACAFVSEERQNKIEKLYNLDGPGFSTEILNSEEMLRMKNRLVSWYPHQSIVGMLFYHYPEGYSVVKSSAALILQHDLATWRIQGKYPKKEKQLSELSNYLYRSFNEWYENLPGDEKRAQFIDEVFSILECSSKDTLSAMIGDVQVDLSSAIDGAKSKDKTFVRKSADTISNIGKIIVEGSENFIKSNIAMAKGTIELMKNEEQRKILIELMTQLLKVQANSAKELIQEKKEELNELATVESKNIQYDVMANLSDAADIAKSAVDSAVESGKNIIDGLLGRENKNA